MTESTTSFGLSSNAPASPGAAVHTAASGPWINVKDAPYNAKGDGTTDDTAAIQAALDACNAAGGGKVIFPRGNYVFTKTLTVYSHQTWEGANQYATTLEYHGDANANWLHGTDVEHWTVRDIGINGQSWGVPVTGSGHVILLDRSKSPDIHFVSFEHVHIQNAGGAGFKISNPIVSTFDRCAVTNCGTGFDLEGVPNGAAGTSTTLTACYANACGGKGYHLFKMAYTNLIGCAADKNGQAYHIDDCDGVALIGCGAEVTTAKNGLDGTSFLVTNSRGITIQSPFTWQNGADAVRVENNSQGVFVSGAVENEPTGSATASIRVKQDSSAAIPGDTGVSAVLLNN